MRKLIDLTGQKFHRFTVISFSHTADIKGKKMRLWDCECECGNKRILSSSKLNSGKHKSCGCLRVDNGKTKNLRHGHTSGSFSPEYRAWQNMLTRCYNPKATRFEHHGGRGIGVCDKWRNSFEEFFKDVGKRPSPNHTLDRYPDNDGNYEPSNFRWATQKQQSQNRRSTRFIEYNGITKPLIEWTRYLGLSDSSTLIGYIKRNGVEKAMLHYAKRLNK